MNRYKDILVITIFIAVTLISILPCSIYAVERFTLVLDAGHGGKDPGAIGKQTKEKDINLGIVLKLGELIKKNHPDVKVIYTRSTDTFIELAERARIANRNHANLFISIHTNAAQSRSAYGTETYALGLARTEENLRVAKRENSVILLESDYNTKYEGFDPTSTESYIMFDFMQGTNLEQSINLASLVQNQFEGNAGRSDRGVRQAGFWVLRATGMPSILIEVGYISNKTEEAYLSSESGREKITESIYNAFCDYKSDWVRKQNGKVKISHESTKADNVSSKEEAQGQAKNKSNLKRGDRQKSDTSNNITTESQQKVSDEIKTANVSVLDTNNETNDNKVKNNNVYKIQIMASPEQINTKSSRFKGLHPVNYYKEKGFYKYTFGDFSNKDEAGKNLSRIKLQFKDAFIVHFVNGIKVSY